MTLIIIIFILFILLVLLYVNCNIREDMNDISNEAVQNIASIYNNADMNTTNLTVTNNLRVLNSSLFSGLVDSDRMQIYKDANVSPPYLYYNKDGQLGIYNGTSKSFTIDNNGDTNINGTTTLKNATVNGDLKITGNLEIGGSLQVGGNLNVNGETELKGKTIIRQLWFNGHDGQLHSGPTLLMANDTVELESHQDNSLGNNLCYDFRDRERDKCQTYSTRTFIRRNSKPPD